MNCLSQFFNTQQPKDALLCSFLSQSFEVGVDCLQVPCNFLKMLKGKESYLLFNMSCIPLNSHFLPLDFTSFDPLEEPSSPTPTTDVVVLALDTLAVCER